MRVNHVQGTNHVTTAKAVISRNLQGLKRTDSPEHIATSTIGGVGRVFNALG